jgi:hypothetical protein
METRPDTQRWMKPVMGVSIVVSALFFASGSLLTYRLAQCIARPGIPDWEDICRAALLLLSLPVVLLGIKHSLAAAYFMLSGAATALALAILQRTSPVNLHADTFIFIATLLVGLFLYGRSKWLPYTAKE